MSELAIAILGGACSAGVISLWQILLERRKFEMERRKDELKVFKLEIADAIKVMMKLVHNMCWVCWHSDKLKEKTPIEFLDNYNKEAHDLLSGLTEKLAIIAAFDIECFNKLRQYGDALIKLDVDIGTAIVGVKLSAANPYEQFGQLCDKATDMEKTFPAHCSEIFNMAERNFKRMRTK